MTNAQIIKRSKRNRRHGRVRSVVSGTKARPRLSVFRSLSHMSVQLIDDTTGKTLASATTRGTKHKGTKTERALALGKELAEKAKAAGITKVAFDRGGSLYHGRVKAVADGAREGGLEF